MIVFTNVASVGRIVYAIFSRFNEDWKTAGKNARNRVRGMRRRSTPSGVT